jgi:hypothetical protein
MSPTSLSPESVDSLALGKGNESFGRLVNMSTIVRKRSEVSIADGVYRAIVADIEPNVPSRFSSREDLVRIGLDLAQAVEGQKPRLWLVSTPVLQDRLQALVEAALRRSITDDEAEGFDLEELLGKSVNVVVASVRSRAGVTYSRIITFLPTEEDDEAK